MKKLITIIAMTCFMASISGAIYSQEVISGMVTDPAQSPIAGALIQAVPGNSTTSTDSKGRFELKLPIGTMAVVISKTSFVKKEISTLNLRQLVSVANQKKKIIHIQLQRAMTAENSQVKVTGLSALNDRMIIGRAQPSRPLGLSRYKRYYQNPSYPLPTESYAHQEENGFKSVSSAPLSTFSIDVDKASYSNIRRMIAGGQLPPTDAVRTEEMINYFDYHYDQPKGNQPINLISYMGTAPWNPKHQLIQIGVQGKKIPTGDLPASNLVFLIDVSGSMSSSNKLPLLITGFKMLTDQLRDKDRVAIVTYAGNSRTVLKSTVGSKKEKIKAALDQLKAGGSTNGSGGIKMAYAIAEKHFMKKGNNRVILASDGDFNVGPSSLADLEKLIVEKRKSGTYLSVLGFGMGNYKDDKMEKLADKGNGNYAYIDNSMEAQRVLLKEFGGTIFTIANDVKIQVEFNPVMVSAYRLIGYENRALAAEDFNQDTVDAGEMGSGQSVTALYEIILKGTQDDKWMPKVDPLKYQYNQQGSSTGNTQNGEWATIKLRYKKPGEKKSQLISQLVKGNNSTIHPAVLARENFQFAAAVAGLSMLLRHSDYVQGIDFNKVIHLAQQSKGQDMRGDRAGFIQLALAAKALQGNQAKNTPHIHYRTPPVGYKPGPKPLTNCLVPNPLSSTLIGD